LISVSINGTARDGIDEGWIASTIQSLRREGIEVCVRVDIRGTDVNASVHAGRCPAGPSSSRPPSPREKSLFDEWSQCRLRDDPDFAPGRLIQCVKRIERFA
jgi:hypothetical protein